ncbi:MAG: bifunctional diguanylate cyclase/phosphodiesterase [Desulfurobacteriaceae bacterium]
MEFFELVKELGLKEEDIKKFRELLPFFSENFKKSLSKKTKEYIFEHLPRSAEFLEEREISQAFEGTIENFLELLLRGEANLEVYLRTISKTHFDAGISLVDFLKDFAVFYRETVSFQEIPPEKEDVFRKFIFFVFLSGVYVIMDGLKHIEKTKEIDRITKLPNRSYFMSHGRKIINDSKTAVLIDLDNFREINFYCGYPVGNSLLALVSSLLQFRFRESSIFRLENDEFLLLTSLDLEKTKERLFALKREAEEFATLPTKYGMMEIRPSFSAVIIELEFPLDPDTLTWVLTRSLLTLTDECKGRIKIIRKEDVECLLSKRKATFHLIEAINQQRIKVAFQKVVSLSSGETFFEEALARVHIGKKKYLSPSSFSELAYYPNIERKIDQIIVEKTLEIMKSYKKEGKVSFNLSSSFLNESFFWFLEKVDEYKIPKERIFVELTERDDILEMEGIKEKIFYLRKLGIGVLVDDFGVKYSNYHLLKELDIDGVKIDGSVVKEALKDNLSKIFLECVFKMAKERDVFVVAEFVENQELEELLRDLSLETGQNRVFCQGFLYGKPVII